MKNKKVIITPKRVYGMDTLSILGCVIPLLALITWGMIAWGIENLEHIQKMRYGSDFLGFSWLDVWLSQGVLIVLMIIQRVRLGYVQKQEYKMLLKNKVYQRLYVISLRKKFINEAHWMEQLQKCGLADFKVNQLFGCKVDWGFELESVIVSSAYIMIGMYMVYDINFPLWFCVMSSVFFTFLIITNVLKLGIDARLRVNRTGFGEVNEELMMDINWLDQLEQASLKQWKRVQEKDQKRGLLKYLWATKEYEKANYYYQLMRQLVEKQKERIKSGWVSKESQIQIYLNEYKQMHRLYFNIDIKDPSPEEARLPLLVKSMLGLLLLNQFLAFGIDGLVVGAKALGENWLMSLPLLLVFQTVVIMFVWRRHKKTLKHLMKSLRREKILRQSSRMDPQSGTVQEKTMVRKSD